MEIKKFQEQIKKSLASTGLGVYTPGEINESLHPEDDHWDEGNMLIICMDLASNDETVLFPGFILKNGIGNTGFEAYSIIPPGPIYVNKDIPTLITNILTFYKTLKNLEVDAKRLGKRRIKSLKKENRNPLKQLSIAKNIVKNNGGNEVNLDTLDSVAELLHTYSSGNKDCNLGEDNNIYSKKTIKAFRNLISCITSDEILYNNIEDKI